MWHFCSLTTKQTNQYAGSCFQHISERQTWRCFWSIQATSYMRYKSIDIFLLSALEPLAASKHNMTVYNNKTYIMLQHWHSQSPPNLSPCLRFKNILGNSCRHAQPNTHTSFIKGMVATGWTQCTSRCEVTATLVWSTKQTSYSRKTYTVHYQHLPLWP